MELKVPGLTVRLEVVLASMVLGFVIAMLTVSSCSKVTLKEGLTVMDTLYSLGDGSQNTKCEKCGSENMTPVMNSHNSPMVCNQCHHSQPHSTHKSTPVELDGDESPMMSKWVGNAHAYAQNMGDGYQTVLDRVSGNVGTKVPLEGTMVFYKDNEFKPECCPSSYTSSTGCMCTSPEQVKYLAQRGGNRSINNEF